MVNFSLLLRPSTAPAEIVPRARNQLRINFRCFRRPRATAREPPWVLQGQHEGERRQRSHARDLPECAGLRIPLARQPLDLPIHLPDLHRQLLDHPKHRGKPREELLRDRGANPPRKRLRRARRKSGPQRFRKAPHLVDQLAACPHQSVPGEQQHAVTLCGTPPGARSASVARDPPVLGGPAARHPSGRSSCRYRRSAGPVAGSPRSPRVPLASVSD